MCLTVANKGRIYTFMVFLKTTITINTMYKIIFFSNSTNTTILTMKYIFIGPYIALLAIIISKFNITIFTSIRFILNFKAWFTFYFIYLFFRTFFVLFFLEFICYFIIPYRIHFIAICGLLVHFKPDAPTAGAILMVYITITVLNITYFFLTIFFLYFFRSLV